MLNTLCFYIFQANFEGHGSEAKFLALRVYAGPPGLNGPNQQDLLVALGLHDDGGIVFGGPLFGNRGDDDDDDDDDADANADDADDDDDEEQDDDIQIIYESIVID